MRRAFLDGLTGLMNNFFTASNLYDGNNLNFSIVRYQKRDIFFSNPHLKKKQKKQHARLRKHLGLQPVISDFFGFVSYLQSGVMALPL